MYNLDLWSDAKLDLWSDAKLERVSDVALLGVGSTCGQGHRLDGKSLVIRHDFGGV